MYTLGEYPVLMHVVAYVKTSEFGFIRDFITSSLTGSPIPDTQVPHPYFSVAFPLFSLCQHFWVAINHILTTISFSSSVPLCFSFIRLLATHTSEYLLNRDGINNRTNNKSFTSKHTLEQSDSDNSPDDNTNPTSHSGFSAPASNLSHCRVLCKSLLSFCASPSKCIQASAASLILFLLHLEFSMSVRNSSQLLTPQKELVTRTSFLHPLRLQTVTSGDRMLFRTREAALPKQQVWGHLIHGFKEMNSQLSYAISQFGMFSSLEEEVCFLFELPLLIMDPLAS
jgi:hypothetical protein